MKLTVLGNSAAYPGPGHACSGFLVQKEDSHLLVDCGTGVLSNIQRYVDLRDVSDIVVSHMHADHFIDLIPYRYALRYGLEQSGNSRPRLHLPPGGVTAMHRVVAPFSESEGFFSDVFEISEYDPRTALQLGNLSVSFEAVKHYVPSYAMSIIGSGKIAYSSDSAYCPELPAVAKDANVFLCNTGRCMIPDSESLWGHLRPQEAGAAASEANVGRLILSHFWPVCDTERCLQEAYEAFGGEVEIARQCFTYEV